MVIFMEKFDLKKHNKKMFEFAKRAARGTYPSKKVAMKCSVVGTFVGIVLVLIGVVGSLLGSIFGIGSLLAGITTVISNRMNIKRISNVLPGGRSKTNQ